MIKFDELKKALEELKKNVNMSYASQPNATTGTSGGQGGMYRSEHMDKNVVAPVTMQMSEDVKKGGMIGQDMVAMSEETIKADHNGQWRIEKSAFKDLQHKIERQGHSKESAAAITASIGRKEIGQKEMTARSKAAMNKVDPDENVNIPHPQGKASYKPDSVARMSKEEDEKLGTNQRIANPPQKDCPDPRGKVHMVKDEGTNEEANPSKPHNKGKFKVMDEIEEKSSEKASPKGKPYSDKGEVKKADKVLVGTGTNDENKAPGRHSGFGL